MKYVFLLYLHSIWITFSYGQDLLVTPLLDNRKFQGVEFYNFLEDQRGFLWVGSDHGVFRYDGNDLINYTTQDSFPFNDVLSVFEDVTGRIWCSTFRKGLFYYDYEKNDVQVPSWNSRLVTHLKDAWVSDLFVAKDSSIWVQKFSFSQKMDFSVFEIQGDSIWAYDCTNLIVVNSLLERSIFTAAQKKLFYQIKQALLKKTSSSNLDSSVEEDFFVGVGKNSIVSYNALYTRQHKEGEHIVRKLIRIDSSEWLGLSYHGFIKHSSLPDRTLWLSDYQINDVCKLSNGNYLFSTSQHGIFTSSSIDVQKQDLGQSEVVMAIHKSNNKLYIKTKSSIYCKTLADAMPKKMFSIKNNYKNVSLPSRFLVWNGAIIINDVVLFNGKQIPFLNQTVKDLIQGRSKSIDAINDSLLIISGAEGFLTLDRQQNLVTNSKDLGYNIWTYTANVVATSTLWLGTVFGVVEYNYKNHSLDTIALPKKQVSIRHIKGKKKTGLFLGSLRQGLFIASPNGKWISVGVAESLNANQISSIALENDTTAWVGTSNGINKVCFSPSELDVEVYSYVDGISILDLEVLGDTVFAVGEGLLLSFPKKIKALGEKKSSILFTDLEINGKKHPIGHQKFYLKREENTLQIHFTKVNFDKKAPTVFCYTLLGEESKDTIWQLTTEHSINYAQLKPGAYRFLLTTQDALDHVEPPIQQLDLVIEKHFIDTIYFQWLIYLLIILITSGLAWVFIVIVKRRAELRRALVESQLKLLRTQMNPHFLFNSLNSILAYITMQDLWTATVYLSNFAKLVRNILENSKRSFLPLGEELEMLETYIDLEKMRLGDQYHISIELKNEIPLNAFYIPPMFIQPFIENSIIHGLRPQEGGEILILFELQSNDVLSIVIQDNGIGRVAAKKIVSSFEEASKTSLGIQNIEEHINIINKTYQLNTQLFIEDLYHSNGQAKGTMVQILLPKFDYLSYLNSQ